jgi:hypothetical protein
MSYLSRFKPVAIVVVILLAIGLVEFVVVDRLKRETGGIVLDTLPGLSDAGQINSEVGGNFIRTLLVITANSPEERAAYRREINEASQHIIASLQEYEKTIHEPQERELYDTLLARRKKYAEIRNAVFDLCDKNQRDEALLLFKTALLPAYEEYTRTGDAIFAYNMRQGETRGDHILWVCNATQLLVVVIGIAIFISGFLTPFIAVRFPPRMEMASAKDQGISK